MVAHGGKRASDISGFTSIDDSLHFAQQRLSADERKRALVSATCEKFVRFLQKAWVICPISLVKHLDEFSIRRYLYRQLIAPAFG